MKVLLWKNIEKLGDRGDVVDVAPGYARNYLFRKQWATPNTPENRRRLEEQRERLEREEQERISENQELLSHLEDLYCIIEVECNEEGVLFGSVTPKIISNAIEEQSGIELSGRQVNLEKPIKEVGVYNVGLNLHPEVKGKMRTWIVQRDRLKES